jgi:hypothetical protein
VVGTYGLNCFWRSSLVSKVHTNNRFFEPYFGAKYVPKGQDISEGHYGPKKQRRKIPYFLPYHVRSGQIKKALFKI